MPATTIAKNKSSSSKPPKNGDGLKHVSTKVVDHSQRTHTMTPGRGLHCGLIEQVVQLQHWVVEIATFEDNIHRDISVTKTRLVSGGPRGSWQARLLQTAKPKCNVSVFANKTDVNLRKVLWPA